MKIGFIGTGNMGGALARAAAKAVAPENILLSDQCAEKAQALADELGCATADIQTLAASCDYLFLGVKPQVMGDMLSQIAPVLASRKDGFVLVSMAAGIAMADICRLAGGNYPVIRIMPNLPVSVGSGMILFDATENVSENQVSAFCGKQTDRKKHNNLKELVGDDNG